MMEIIVAILIFALVSASCVAIFAKARNKSRDASELVWASDEASDIAEMVRNSSSAEEFLKTAGREYPTASVSGSEITLYAHADGTECGEADADVELRVVTEDKDGVLTADIRASETESKEEVLSTKVRHVTR